MSISSVLINSECFGGAAQSLSVCHRGWHRFCLLSGGAPRTRGSAFLVQLTATLP